MTMGGPAVFISVSVTVDRLAGVLACSQSCSFDCGIQTLAFSIYGQYSHAVKQNLCVLRGCATYCSLDSRAVPHAR